MWRTWYGGCEARPVSNGSSESPILICAVPHPTLVRVVKGRVVKRHIGTAAQGDLGVGTYDAAPTGRVRQA